MTVGPRRRRPLVFVIVGAVVAVVLGFSIFEVLAGSDAAQVPGLVRAINAVPVPAGSTKVGETDTEGHGDVTATVERQYRLSDAQSTAMIQKVLVDAHYQVLDLQTGDTADVPGGPWAASVSATSGDVYVLPPHRTGGGIEYHWQGDDLRVTAQDGALDGS